MTGNVAVAKARLSRCAGSQLEWKQLGFLCAYELAWCHAFQHDWRATEQEFASLEVRRPLRLPPPPPPTPPPSAAARALLLLVPPPLPPLPLPQVGSSCSRTFYCFMQGVAQLQMGRVGQARATFVRVLSLFGAARKLGNKVISAGETGEEGMALKPSAALSTRLLLFPCLRLRLPEQYALCRAAEYVALTLPPDGEAADDAETEALVAPLRLGPRLRVPAAVEPGSAAHAACLAFPAPLLGLEAGYFFNASRQMDPIALVSAQGRSTPSSMSSRAFRRSTQRLPWPPPGPAQPPGHGLPGATRLWTAPVLHPRLRQSARLQTSARHSTLQRAQCRGACRREAAAAEEVASWGACLAAEARRRCQLTRALSRSCPCRPSP